MKRDELRQKWLGLISDFFIFSWVHGVRALTALPSLFRTM